MNSQESHYINEEEWNCGLLALRDAFSILNMNISYLDLRSHYFNLGFKLYEFGVTSVHIALVAKMFDFNVVLKTPSKWLKSLYELKGKQVKSGLKISIESKDVVCAINKLINYGGEIKFFSNAKSPNIKNVLSSLQKGALVIICVNAKQYYGINEEWNHYLVAYKDIDSKDSFTVIDSLENIGNIFYPEWNKYVENAKRFNWSKWAGDIIEIMKQ